ncbi:MAG: hypothetical protein AAF456_08215 [Planctomycetota bacterium]
MKKTLLPVITAICCLMACTHIRGDAVTYTFDTSADLIDNFNLDVVTGDANTNWRSGYSAGPPIEASDGGFVHVNQYNTSNSIQFADGPVYLNSFEISSNYDQSENGRTFANAAADDYHLILYDSSFNVLFDQTLTASPTGSWDEVTFDIANVSTIWIDRRDGDGTGTGGWWPNLDNIRVNQIPEPCSMAIVSLAGCVVALSRRK